MSANRGIYLAPFDELVDPRVLAELANRAEAQGWNGFFVWDHVAYRELANEVRALRPDGGDTFELVVETPPGDDPGPWEAAGATWVLTGFGSQPREAELREVIDAGPH